MLATELEAVVPTDAVRNEMEALIEVAKALGTDAGFHTLPDEFEKRLEPRLRLLREKFFRDSAEAGEARDRRAAALEAEQARCQERVDAYRSRWAAGAQALRPSLWHRWPAAVSVAAAAVLLGLGLEELGGIPVSARLATMLGLAAGLLIVNLEALAAAPARVRARWHSWIEYRRALSRLRVAAAESERLRVEELERAWVRRWAGEFMQRLHGALLVEYGYHKARAAAARGI